MTGGDGRHERFERGGRGESDRGVSEFAGVAILIAITLLVTGSVGLFVLVDPGSENPGPNANFTFEYIDSSSVLVVTHERGDNFTAGNLTFRSGETAVRWSALANSDANRTVSPGATVQLSRRNAYGNPVNPNDRIAVVYAPPVGNETVLDNWNGTG
ncbi:type IV pilin N-terminal domain-containing protein [Halosimplex rubrum]|uniref:Type IV pilin N-terminal domain-containing protein n=1 Tax=Halosimplex rubrum TaxID=869889 RepID=A0A7D5TQ45_9EURY|nr:type IV pilin N-terminal domain-containing protein [Halosimplex rubrum]QLH78594.1 type IV pilin N-terminal domain-containing protein [Halosimplex rubrum]